MLKRTLLLTFSMLTLSAALMAQGSPVMGTWKLNLAKSKYNPGPPPKSQTTKREPSGANGVHYVADSVTADGEKRHIEYTAN